MSKDLLDSNVSKIYDKYVEEYPYRLGQSGIFKIQLTIKQHIPGMGPADWVWDVHCGDLQIYPSKRVAVLDCNEGKVEIPFTEFPIKIRRKGDHQVYTTNGNYTYTTFTIWGDKKLYHIKSTTECRKLDYCVRKINEIISDFKSLTTDQALHIYQYLEIYKYQKFRKELPIMIVVAIIMIGGFFTLIYMASAGMF